MAAFPWIEASGGLVLGAGVGAILTGLWAWSAAKRTVARVRSAERRARSAERLAELGAMSGGLAHEIKNPLSTIGLNAQLLGEGIEELALAEEEKARLTRRIGTLRREVERLRGILTDFLQYAGEMRLEPRPTDVNTVVGELVDFFLPQAEKQGVRLRADLSPGALIATIDAPHVKQALLNLMLNAVQAMGGHRAEGPRELILKTLRPRADEVQVHVIDTGPGIEPATRERLFEPYFTTKPGGTGLGLATARRIAEAHDGRLDLFSEPGKGSDFVLCFPVSPTSPGR